MSNGTDRRDKGVFMDALNRIALTNKLCRVSRKRFKRITSKAVRSAAKLRSQEDAA